MTAAELPPSEVVELGWARTRVVALYCLAGRKAAAPPARRHSTKAATATRRLARTSRIT